MSEIIAETTAELYSGAESEKWVARVYKPSAGQRPPVKITRNGKLYAIGEINGRTLVNVEPPIESALMSLRWGLQEALLRSAPVPSGYVERMQRRAEAGDEDAQLALDHALELRHMRGVAGEREIDLKGSTFSAFIEWVSTTTLAWIDVRFSAQEAGLPVAKRPNREVAAVICAHLKDNPKAGEESGA